MLQAKKLQARLLHMRRKGGESTLFEEECSVDFLSSHREYSLMKMGLQDALGKLEKFGSIAHSFKEWGDVAYGALEDLCGVDCVEARVGRDLCENFRKSQRAILQLLEACLESLSDLKRPLRDTVDSEFADVSKAKDSLYEALVAKRGSRARADLSADASRHYDRYASSAAIEEDRAIGTMESALAVASQRIGRSLREVLEREVERATEAAEYVSQANEAAVRQIGNTSDDSDDDSSSSVDDGDAQAMAARPLSPTPAHQGAAADCRRKAVEKYGGVLSFDRLNELCREAGIDDTQRCTTISPNSEGTRNNNITVDDVVALREARPSVPGQFVVTTHKIFFSAYEPVHNSISNNDDDDDDFSGVLAASRQRASFDIPIEALDPDETRAKDEILEIVAKDRSKFALSFHHARSTDRTIAETSAQALEGVRAKLAEAWTTTTTDALVRSSLRRNVVVVPASDYDRLGVTRESFWRQTKANRDYKLCPTYPSILIVPSPVSDAEVDAAASYRSKRRLVALSWRNFRLDTPGEIALLRAAQPLAGVQKSTSADDERLVRCVAVARPLRYEGGAKLRIFDARPYANVAANVLAGKGVEDAKTYAKEDMSVDIVFLGIDNIHVMRAAYTALKRAIEASYASSLVHRRNATTPTMGRTSHYATTAFPSKSMLRRATATTFANNRAGVEEGKKTEVDLDEFHSGTVSNSFDFDEEAARAMLKSVGKKRRRALGVGVKKTWLDHVSCILRGAVEIARCLVDERTSALVHCSDGWDRTSQLTSLAMLLVDEHYRTLRGFATLVEKEWCSFGHMFAKRNGGAAGKKQTSPVFVQWLDAVWQIWRQLPPAFEFDCSLLDVIAERSYCGSHFATFHGNSELERRTALEHAPSVWTDLLDNPIYKNAVYEPRGCGATLHPLATTSKLRIWPAHAKRWTRTTQVESFSGTGSRPFSTDNVLHSLRESRQQSESTKRVPQRQVSPTPSRPATKKNFESNQLCGDNDGDQKSDHAPAPIHQPPPPPPLRKEG